jgi:ribosome-binding factor A
MPKEFSRSRRVARQLKQELATAISREMRDPRVQGVCVSDVDISRDLAHAKVFISLLSDNAEEINQAVDSLNRASGFLRNYIAKSMQLRIVPSLTFSHDTTLSEGNRLSRLIDAAVSHDKESLP